MGYLQFATTTQVRCATQHHAQRRAHWQKLLVLARHAVYSHRLNPGSPTDKWVSPLQPLIRPSSALLPPQFYLYGKRNCTLTGWERARKLYPKPDPLEDPALSLAGKTYMVTGWSQSSQHGSGGSLDSTWTSDGGENHTGP